MRFFKSHFFRHSLIALAIFALAFGMYHWSLNRMVASRLAELRAAGVPTMTGDLLKLYTPLPPDQNASRLYAEALETMQKPKESLRPYLYISGSATAPAIGQRMPVPMLKAAEAYLLSNKEALSLLVKASPESKARFLRIEKTLEDMIDPNSTAEDMLATLDTIHTRRDAAMLLAYQAEVGANQKHPTQTAEALHACFLLAGADEKSLSMVSMLRDMTIQAMATGTVERAINLTNLPDDDLTKLQEVSQRFAPTSRLSWALVCERAAVNEILVHKEYRDVPQGLEWDSWQGQLYVRLSHLAGLGKLDTLRFHAMMDEAQAIARKPTHEWMDAYRELAERVGYLSWWKLETTAYAGSFPKVAEIMLKVASSTCVVRAALAIERYHLAEGKLPDNLDNIAPRFIDVVPTDPFTGKPVIYKRVGDGYMVYSVGDDGEDNSGLRRNAEGREFEPGTDIVFEVGIPHPPRTLAEMMPYAPEYRKITDNVGP